MAERSASVGVWGAGIFIRVLWLPKTACGVQSGENMGPSSLLFLLSPGQASLSISVSNSQIQENVVRPPELSPHSAQPLGSRLPLHLLIWLPWFPPPHP